ncbi:Uncharacterised protein [Mycobacteroides abscessus subsp. massiliense]|nr:Uncharacterised protein [Mycobacteroides abscessus subsp. massiliense]
MLGAEGVFCLDMGLLLGGDYRHYIVIDGQLQQQRMRQPGVGGYVE